MALCNRATPSNCEPFWLKPNLRALFWAFKGELRLEHALSLCPTADGDLFSVWKRCDNALMALSQLHLMSLWGRCNYQLLVFFITIHQVKSEDFLLGVIGWVEVGSWPSLMPHIWWGLLVGGMERVQQLSHGTLFAVTHVIMHQGYPVIASHFYSSQIRGPSSERSKVSWGRSISIHCATQLLNICWRYGKDVTTLSWQSLYCH
jgi:hypothetical protein